MFCFDFDANALDCIIMKDCDVEEPCLLITRLVAHHQPSLPGMMSNYKHVWTIPVGGGIA